MQGRDQDEWHLEEIFNRTILRWISVRMALGMAGATGFKYSGDGRAGRSRMDRDLLQMRTAD